VRMSTAWKDLQDISAREKMVSMAYQREQGPESRIWQFAKLYLFHPSSAFFTCPLAMADGAARVLEMFGREIGQNREKQWHSSYNEDHIDDLMCAYDYILENLTSLFVRHQEYIYRFAPKMHDLSERVNRLLKFIEIVGKNECRRIELHNFRLRNKKTRAQPLDLQCALKSGKLLHFEVKFKDKMLGSQGAWIKDIGRPLQLNYGLIKVIDDGNGRKLVPTYPEILKIPDHPRVKKDYATYARKRARK